MFKLGACRPCPQPWAIPTARAAPYYRAQAAAIASFRRNLPTQSICVGEQVEAAHAAQHKAEVELKEAMQAHKAELEAEKAHLSAMLQKARSAQVLIPRAAFAFPRMLAHGHFVAVDAVLPAALHCAAAMIKAAVVLSAADGSFLCFCLAVSRPSVRQAKWPIPPLFIPLQTRHVQSDYDACASMLRGIICICSSIRRR